MVLRQDAVEDRYFPASISSGDVVILAFPCKSTAKQESVKRESVVWHADWKILGLARIASSRRRWTEVFAKWSSDS